MKKKYIIFSSIAAIAVVLSIWLLTRPEVLGNMNHTYSEPTTSVSEFSFTAEAGDEIKFSFASNIKNGALDILLCDSKENIVKELDKAKELETFAILDDSDTYTLKAKYNDFVGNFKVAIYDWR